MNERLQNYFLGISDSDLRQQKMQVRKVRIATNAMLRSEAKTLIRQGY